MSSYLTLELDTTGPQVEVYAPNYVTTDSITEIRIVANELLMETQNIYLTDINGNIHKIDCLYNGKEFEGKLYLNAVPLGLITLNAIVKDIVGNISELKSKTIRLVKSKQMNISINDSQISNVYTTDAESAHINKIENAISSLDIFENTFSPRTRITEVGVQTNIEVIIS